jgi:branched-subunit amino acid aminotransferase/4-amino-4-deoxychorismate lyase
MAGMGLAWLNGAVPSADEIAGVLGNNYGHFTTMQVRRGEVQGLELHLQRLEQANLELFGDTLPQDTAREAMRQALQHFRRADCTLRAIVTARDPAPDRAQVRGRVDLLVRCAPPAVAGDARLHLKSFNHERDLPHIKHLGTFTSFHFRRLATLAGCDDALFVDAKGRISEGTFWNIGFWQGDSVVWPEAPALRGTCQHLVQAGLDGLAVRQVRRRVCLGDVAGFDGAFVSNARGVQAVARIEDVAWPADPARLQRVRRALSSQPWQAI